MLKSSISHTTGVPTDIFIARHSTSLDASLMRLASYPRYLFSRISILPPLTKSDDFSNAFTLSVTQLNYIFAALSYSPDYSLLNNAA